MFGSCEELPSWGNKDPRKAVDGVDTVSRGVGWGGANKAISGSYAISKSGREWLNKYGCVC